MKHNPLSMVNRKKAKNVLRLPDFEFAKTAVLSSLTSLDAQRGYRHAVDEFVDWYCSEPRLAFNRIVVLRYRTYLETRQLASGTIYLRLGAVRRLAPVLLSDPPTDLKWPSLPLPSPLTELPLPSDDMQFEEILLLSDHTRPQFGPPEFDCSPGVVLQRRNPHMGSAVILPERVENFPQSCRAIQESVGRFPM